MKALVTGGTGFVGSHLIDALHERGDSVTALVRSAAKARGLAPRGVRLVMGTLHDQPALASAAADQDVVYHVAGLVAARTPDQFDKANREGTANVVAAATASGVGRFVMVSSMAAVGPSQPGRPHRGDEPPAPVTEYGRSKLAGEAVLRSSALAWTILRPPMVYGPRDAEVFKVFQLAQRGIAPVFGSGNQELSAVTGPDLAQALIATAVSDRSAGSCYYPCHPDVFTSRAFAQAVGRTLGKRVWTPGVPAWLARAILSGTGAMARLAGKATLLNADKANEFLQDAWTGDPGPLTRDTNWVARHDLADGLAAAAEWYREAGWL
jgi:nucleoside-diphosphate-sugar epimerase